MHHWALTESELLGVLREARITLGPGSPLGVLDAAAPTPEATAIENKLHLVEALASIARPDEVFGIAGGLPPVDPDLSWFYGARGAPQVAFHREGASRDHYIAWPLDHFQILDALWAPLISERAADIAGIDLAIDAAGLVALAALVDAAQETSALALLDRTPPPDVTFGVDELRAAARRGTQSADLRWMVPRVLLIAPVPLAFDADAISRGVDSLRGSGLVDVQDGRITPREMAAACCLLLGACSGVSALSARRRGVAASDPPWRLAHTAAWRGLDGRLWAFEFGDIAADDFQVRIHDANGQTVHERFASGLFEGPPARDVPPTPTGTTKAPPGPAFCTKCGARLRPDSRFCAHCGAPLR